MEGKELTLEALAAQLQDLKNGNAAADQVLTELQEQNAQLKEQNSKLFTQNEGLKAAMQSIASNKTESSITIAAPKLPKIPADATFKLNKIKYEVVVPSCHIPGIGYRTAEDIIMDEEAQKALIDMGSFAIRKVS